MPMDETTAILDSSRPIDDIINDLKEKSVCVPLWDELIKDYEPTLHLPERTKQNLMVQQKKPRVSI